MAPDMSGEISKDQKVRRRKPSQERALRKIELLLESATRIIDQKGLEGLTTNLIAETAGISIGTLYQYFPNKQAIIDTLGQRELRDITNKLITALREQSSHDTDDLAKSVIRTIFGAFNGRSRVYRLLLGNVLAQGNHQVLDGAATIIAGILTSNTLQLNIGSARQLSKAEAFVLTWAFVGVIRAAVVANESNITSEQIEDALLTLVQRFFG